MKTETLSVVITANNSSFKKALRETQSAVNGLSNSVNKQSKNPFQKATEGAQGLGKSIREAGSSTINAGGVKELEKALAQAERQAESLRRKMEILDDKGKAQELSPAFKDLTGKYEEESKRLATLRQQYNDHALPNGQSFGKGGYDIGAALDQQTAKVAELKRQLDDLRIAGGKYQPTAEMESLGQQADAAEQKVASLKEQLASAGDAGSTIQKAGKEANKFSSILKALGASARNTGNILKNAFAKAGSVIGKGAAAITKNGGAFKSLLNRYVSGIPIIGRFTREQEKGHMTMQKGIRMLLMYGFGIRSLYFLVNKVRSAVSEAMKHLAAVDSSANRSMSELTSSLTMLKGSLASAFAPIVETIAPILSGFIRQLADAINAVGAFFAALTGHSTYKKAVYNMVSYGAATDKATKSTKALQRTILGFDQINKLDDNSGSGGSGGGGAGGGNGGFAWEDAKIGDNINSFADMVRKAWEEADFTEIGNIVAQKIADSLNAIPWGKIQIVCNKIAKSVGTFINGALENKDLWPALGNTIAEVINTYIGTVSTFFNTVEFDKLGEDIGTMIKTAIGKIRWTGEGGLGNYLSALPNAIIDTVTGFTHNFKASDFRMLGSDIARAVNDAIKRTHWKDLFPDTLNIANGILSALNGYMSTRNWGSILNKIADGIPKKGDKSWSDLGSNIGEAITHGLDAVTGIANGLANVFRRIDWETVFTAMVKRLNRYDGWEKLGNSIGNVLASALSNIAGILSGLIRVFKAIKWKEVLEGMKESFKQYIKDNKGTLGKDLGEIISAGLTITGAIFAIEVAKMTIKNTGLALLSKIAGAPVAGAGKTLGSFVKNIAMVGGIVLTISTIKDIINASTKSTLTMPDEIKTSLKGGAAGALVGFKFAGVKGALIGFTVGASLSFIVQEAEFGNVAHALSKGFNDMVNSLPDSVANFFFPGKKAQHRAETYQSPKEILSGAETLSEPSDNLHYLDPASWFRRKQAENQQHFKDLEDNRSGNKNAKVAPDTLVGVGGEVTVSAKVDPKPVWKTIQDFMTNNVIKSIVHTTDSLSSKPIFNLIQRFFKNNKFSSWFKTSDANSSTPMFSLIQRFFRNNKVKAGMKTDDESSGNVLFQNAANFMRKNKIFAWLRTTQEDSGGNVFSVAQEFFNNHSLKASASPASGAKSSLFGDFNDYFWNHSLKAGASPANGARSSLFGDFNDYFGSHSIKVYASLAANAASNLWHGIQNLFTNNPITASVKKNAGGGIYRNGRWHPITAAAGGGTFTTGQMFVAREAGPELVGTIGGNTAVMNNNQIVSSVAAGVYEAVVSAMAQAGSGQAPTIEVTVQADTETLYRQVRKGQKLAERRYGTTAIM